MDWVLPMTVGVWPFVAGMGLGWYSVVALVVGAFGVRYRTGRGHQRLRWRTPGSRVMT